MNIRKYHKLNHVDEPPAADAPVSSKLLHEDDLAANRQAHLRFGREESAPDADRTLLSRMKHRPVQVIGRQVSGFAHQQMANNEDDNAGTNALNEGTRTAEDAADTVSNAVQDHRYSKKLQKRKAEEASAESQAAKEETERSASSSASKTQQKRRIRREYANAKRSAGTSTSIFSSGAKKTEEVTTDAAETIKEGVHTVKETYNKAKKFVKEHWLSISVITLCVLVLAAVCACFSSCSAMSVSTGQAITATTYTAEDEDILGAEEDYQALEATLQAQIDNMESSYPSYDAYEYNVTQIGHDPYQLASCLTVLYGSYTRDEVQDTLQDLFDRQYSLTVSTSTEARTRTVTETHTRRVRDPVTHRIVTEEYEEEVQEDYDYVTLTVTLVNSGLDSAIRSSGLSESELEWCELLNETQGNRPDLFENSAYVLTTSEYQDYSVPSEALTDTAFAGMIREAEKYLGFPYVWGGSSPSTSFDCSGFVCWVINHSGNGWNVGRTTANNLLNTYCTRIPASEAKPGDLIFFQGTYNTSGASHVGIFVGNGMMIHAGNPIQYASVNTNYWKQHFYTYARIK